MSGGTEVGSWHPVRRVLLWKAVSRTYHKYITQLFKSKVFFFIFPRSITSTKFIIWQGYSQYFVAPVLMVVALWVLCTYYKVWGINYKIIYPDFLPPPRRGSHVKSDNTRSIIQHTPLSPYTWHLSHDFQFVVSSVYRVSQQHRVMASHPSPGDNHRSMGGRSERARPSKNGRVKLIQLHICQGSQLFPIFRALSRSPHRHENNSYLLCLYKYANQFY